MTREKDEDRGSKFEIKAYGRFSYTHVFVPKAFAGAKDDDSGSDPKYQSAFLIPKKDEDVYNDILDAIEDAIEDKLGKDGKVPRAKWFIKDGDVLADEDGRDECAGFWVVNASNTRAPLVVDKDGTTELTEKDGRPYSGSWGYMIFRVWVQNNKYGKRVNASLEGVQFMKDDEAFGAAPIKKDRFKDERSEEERSARRRSRDEDNERPRRSRDEDEDRGSRRSRDEDEDNERPRRSRDEDRGSRRSRDEDEDNERPRRSRDEDDDRGPRRRRM